MRKWEKRVGMTSRAIIWPPGWRVGPPKAPSDGQSATLEERTEGNVVSTVSLWLSLLFPCKGPRKSSRGAFTFLWLPLPPSPSHSSSPSLSHTLGSLQILQLVIHFTPLLSLCGRTTVPPSQLTKSRSSSLSPRPAAAPAPPYSPRNYPY